MTLGLARRLLWEGVVTPEDVSRALHAHVTRRVSFLQALSEEHPGILPRVELELGGRLEVPDAIEVDAGLFSAAPRALWVMLCAVPLGRTEDGLRVRVAAPDGDDGHVEGELERQLGAPVELQLASPSAVLSALAALSTSSEARPSDPPILLRRVSHEPPAPHTVRGAPSQNPGGLPRLASPAILSPRARSGTSDPVIQLTRTKSLGPPPPSPEAASKPAAVPDSSGAAGLAIEAIEQASSPDDVAVALVRGLGAVCRGVVVLAVKAGTFEGRACSDASARASVRALSVPSDRPSVLLTAVQTGHYLGPMPSTPVHEELGRLLGSPAGEIAVGVVLVSGRPTLVYVGAGMDTAYLATRRGDQLADAASRKLERLLRDRKR